MHRFHYDIDPGVPTERKMYSFLPSLRLKDAYLSRSAFVELLNEMRFGRLSEQNRSRLLLLSREVKYSDSVEPTELYAL